MSVITEKCKVLGKRRFFFLSNKWLKNAAAGKKNSDTLTFARGHTLCIDKCGEKIF